MLSCFFTRAKVAAIVGPLCHFAFLMPRYIFYRTGKIRSPIMQQASQGGGGGGRIDSYNEASLGALVMGGGGRE